MKTRVGKPASGEAVADAVGEAKGRESAPHLTDHRPGSARIHQLQMAADMSPRALQLGAIQRMTDGMRAQHAQDAPVQLAIDDSKLNVVGEDHRQYNGVARQTERQKVTAVFGENSYHVEDTFSAMPDIAQEGQTPDEQDKLQSFASKGDPPYYAITQGLEFITRWCTEFRSYSLDKRLIGLINGAQGRIEREMNGEPLKKVENSNEERDFVLAHDALLATTELADDPNYPEVNRSRGELLDDVRLAVQRLNVATATYLGKIQLEYAQAKVEFEQFMNIDPQDDLIKKRSVTMGFHAMAHALAGNKGVLKVGEYHLVDFENMDLAGATLSTNDMLQDFLRRQ